MEKLTNQSGKFNLDRSVTYLNGAFMSPQLQSVTQAGLRAIAIKENPSVVGVEDFFKTPGLIRAEFSRMINNQDDQRIALIPSVSYGMANITQNLNLKGGRVIVAGEQFPSNVYPWMRITSDQKSKLDIIEPPADTDARGAKWNQRILEAIKPDTSLVALALVHWADGTLFDLVEIRNRTREVGALLIIDGTQSVGALPFDIQEIQPDALVCAGYKWLLGPYGLGLAYYGEAFDGGKPVEENWINRLNSNDFTGLVQYEEQYLPGALRYGMGEQSQFILAPMLLEALKQINEWSPGRIQDYIFDLVSAPVEKLRERGYWIEDENYRANHLFGIRHNAVPIEKIKAKLSQSGIFVSYRGSSLRVSPYVHNIAADIEQLTSALLDLV